MERLRFDITPEQMAQAAPSALRPIYLALDRADWTDSTIRRGDLVTEVTRLA